MWAREQIASQLAIFPEGQLCIEVDGRLAASASSLIVDSASQTDWHDWKLSTDNGFIRNHDPHGDMLYGIEIMVDPEFRGLKLGRMPGKHLSCIATSASKSSRASWRWRRRESNCAPASRP